MTGWRRSDIFISTVPGTTMNRESGSNMNIDDSNGNKSFNRVSPGSVCRLVGYFLLLVLLAWLLLPAVSVAVDGGTGDDAGIGSGDGSGGGSGSGSGAGVGNGIGDGDEGVSGHRVSPEAGNSDIGGNAGETEAAGGVAGEVSGAPAASETPVETVEKNEDKSETVKLFAPAAKSPDDDVGDAVDDAVDDENGNNVGDGTGDGAGGSGSSGEIQFESSDSLVLQIESSSLKVPTPNGIRSFDKTSKKLMRSTDSVKRVGGK